MDPGAWRDLGVMTLIERKRVRRWRDRARPLVLTGLVIYATGFFLDWTLEFELYWLLTWSGGLIVLIGAGCGLLWLVDSSTAGDDENA